MREMVSDAEVTGHVTSDLERTAALRARDRADTAKWDLNVAIFLFAVLIVVMILSFQDVAPEVVSPIAVVGLAAAWFMGRQKGKKLYRRLYDEELSRLSRESARDTTGRSFQETVADAVQKALRDRAG